MQILKEIQWPMVNADFSAIQNIRDAGNKFPDSRDIATLIDNTRQKQKANERLASGNSAVSFVEIGDIDIATAQICPEWFDCGEIGTRRMMLASASHSLEDFVGLLEEMTHYTP